MFIPIEVFFKTGPLRIEPYRLLLIISFFALLKHKKNDGPLIILTCYVLLTSLSLCINHGFSSAIEAGGILYLETCISYSLGLCYVRNKQDHKTIFKIFSIMYLIISGPALIEFITGNKVIHNLFEHLTGNKQLAANLYTQEYMRLGFTRATAVFAHPILYAISATTIIPIILATNKIDKIKIHKLFFNIFGCIIAIITAMTSTAISTLVLQQGLKKWYNINNKAIRKFIISLVLLSMLIIQVGSNRGLIKFVAMSITLDPSTAYYRILQWEFSSDDIANNFFFGIGFNDFTHPSWFSSSIDSYWLLNILQFGVFSQIALILFFIKILMRTFKLQNSTELKELSIAYRISIISVIFSGLTVDFFDRMQPILYFVLGSSAWLFDTSDSRQYANKNLIQRKII